MKTGLIFIFYCFYLVRVYGQEGELGQFDCNYSKAITVPFNYSENQVSVKPQLNQTVFYNYRDQYTFWYRITAKKNGKLNFQVAAVDNSDSYVVYVYQYNNTDFCNKLYNRKIKTFTSPVYAGNNGKGTADTSSQTIEVQEGNVYYISILNVSLNNCGHYFNLSYGADTLKVKALHLPCKKDIATVSVTKKVIPPIKDTVPKNNPVSIPVVKDTVKTTLPVLETKTISNNILCVAKDANSLNFINAKLTITDLDSREPISTVNQGAGQWSMVAEKDKKYKLKCTSFGYTDVEMSFDRSVGQTIELFLKPLKVGDNMVMKSIYFHPNTYALRRESSEELKKLLNYLLDNPNINIEIQGHTNGDNRIAKNKSYRDLGEEWNFQGSSKKLSLKRAEAIKKYLVNNGVTAERMIAKGYGGSKAIVINPETMEEGQKNIRVEVVILKN